MHVVDSPLRRHGPRRRAGGRAAAVVAASCGLALLAAACGGDTGDGDSEASPPPVTAPTASPTTAPAADADPDAPYVYPPVEGAGLTLTNSGAVGGTTEATVDSVTRVDGGQQVSATEVTSGAGEPVTVARTFLTGPDGDLWLSAEQFAATGAGVEVTASGDDVHIPAIGELEAGGTATGETFVEFDGSASSGRNDVVYTVSGDGFDSVAGPDGEVKAYRVVLELEIDSSVTGPGEATMRYWFVPGFGLVRQEAGNAESTLVTELTSSSVPVG